MKRFLILHDGFEKPTPEQMDAWNAWFAAIADRQVERCGLAAGRALSSEGARELPFGRDSLTGYTVIEAADLDEACALARGCPIVDRTTVYEIRG